MLELSRFSDLISMAPLVSLDLIVRTEQGFLLGKRKNQPAKGFWFVPGGRVCKNETINAAFNRIALKELNIELVLSDSIFVGFFEHFYENSFVGENISTHYVVLAFEIVLNHKFNSLPLEEHSEYGYFSGAEILDNELVHLYTRKYFTNKGLI